MLNNKVSIIKTEEYLEVLNYKAMSSRPGVYQLLNPSSGTEDLRFIVFENNEGKVLAVNYKNNHITFVVNKTFHEYSYISCNDSIKIETNNRRLG